MSDDQDTQRPRRWGVCAGCGQWREIRPAPPTCGCAPTNIDHPHAWAARLENYTELRADGHSIQQAAWRLGVSKRTAQRYERELRSGFSTPQPVDALTSEDTAFEATIHKLSPDRRTASPARIPTSPQAAVDVALSASDLRKDNGVSSRERP